jgi:hypothetical protein
LGTWTVTSQTIEGFTDASDGMRAVFTLMKNGSESYSTIWYVTADAKQLVLDGGDGEQHFEILELGSSSMKLRYDIIIPLTITVH